MLCEILGKEKSIFNECGPVAREVKHLIETETEKVVSKLKWTPSSMFQAATKSYATLLNVAKRERLLVPDLQVNNRQDGALHGLSTDKGCLKLMQPFGIQGRPVVTSGDGNCLFNAVSLSLTGDESLSSELRYKAALTMLLHKELVTNACKNLSDIVIVSPDYKDAVNSCLTLGSYSCAWTIMSVSLVIDRSIASIYPPVNGPQDKVPNMLNCTFGSADTNPAITIMWTGNWDSKHQTWVPNHFVAVDTELCTTNTQASTPPLEAEMINEDVQESTPESRKEEFAESLLAETSEISIDLSALSESGNVPSSVPSEVTKPLPNKNYLSIDDLMTTLQSTPLTQCLPEVPIGTKNDCFILVKNEKNLQRRERGLSSQFCDDRGAWDTRGASNKTLFQRQKDQHLRKVVMKHKQYCLERRVNKKYVYIPLQPQPDEKDIVILHRYYVKHSQNAESAYAKRVSWLECNGAPAIACHEYKGICPEGRPHGNTTSGNPGDYIRLQPEIMEQVKDDLKTKRPAGVYKESDSFIGPRNMTQVWNANARLKSTAEPAKKANFADQVIGVEELQQSLSFVQQIVRQSKKIPCIILYLDSQIADVKRFCCPPPSAVSTVLGIDKTFNLSDLHVTTTVFKYLAVTRRDTGEHPIAVGPTFLHGNSDTETFFIFLQHLAGKLFGCHTQPTFGSDEESALTQAIEKSFPASQRLSCERHLKNNMKAFLSDKIGLAKKDRNKILHEVFRKCETETTSSNLEDNLKLMTEELPSKVANYLTKRAIPLLVANKEAITRPGLYTVGPSWTNNNSESYNHVIKQATQWKSLKLVELVHKIHELVRAHYREIQRAFVGMGEFELCEEFARFRIPRDNWCQMDETFKKKRMQQFLAVFKDKDLVRSTSSGRSVRIPKAKGKKPGQTKRKRATRTKCSSKKRRLETAASSNSSSSSSSSM